MAASPVVIDACSALNLLATGQAETLLSVLDWKLIVLTEVRQEAGRLRGPPDEEGRPTWVPTNWSALESAGLMEIQPLGEESLEAFVAAAAHLTDVDAAVVALAGTLNHPLLSDDGKVRRTFTNSYPHLPLHSTLALIREASQRLRMERRSLEDLLRALRLRANFAPPRADPDRDWYREHLRD
jgi:hypothetical protein